MGIDQGLRERELDRPSIAGKLDQLQIWPIKKGQMQALEDKFIDWVHLNISLLL
jgi:hypothetical protein